MCFLEFHYKLSSIIILFFFYLLYRLFRIWVNMSCICCIHPYLLHILYWYFSLGRSSNFKSDVQAWSLKTLHGCYRQHVNQDGKLGKFRDSDSKDFASEIFFSNFFDSVSVSFFQLKEDPSFKPSGGRLGDNDMDYDTDEKSMATLRRQLRIAREDYYGYKRYAKTNLLVCFYLSKMINSYQVISLILWFFHCNLVILFSSQVELEKIPPCLLEICICLLLIINW